MTWALTSGECTKGPFQWSHSNLKCRRGRFILDAKAMRRPGIEPGSQEWESCMIPLHQRRIFLHHDTVFGSVISIQLRSALFRTVVLSQLYTTEIRAITPSQFYTPQIRTVVQSQCYANRSISYNFIQHKLYSHRHAVVSITQTYRLIESCLGV